MLIDATEMAHFPLIKLDAANFVEKMKAIRSACPNAEFIIDTNDSLS
jgi:hypothetical protein